MSRFDKYFQMEAADVLEYTLLKTPDIEWDRESMQVIVPKEHGNLNYVYRVMDGKGHSIYIKQAGTETRISKDMKPSKDRNRLESEILKLENEYAKGMVPYVYFYDTVMCACGMEDCSDFQVMRQAMLEHRIFPHFADNITHFMVETMLKSSDIAIDHKEKKLLVGKFVSPDLCDITEKLVFMEPYNDLNHRNNVYPPNEEFVKKELYEDEALHLEVAKLKFSFMTNAQSLIHGDLHTGSIFIKEDGLKVFDSEFGVFAPCGYDIGNVIANLIFAYDNGLAYDKKEFTAWILDAIRDVVDLFIEKYNKRFDELVSEPMAKVKGFKEYYLSQILRDTAGFTGTELHRRTVGMANVVDVTTIKDEKKRLVAERINIIAGKAFIMNPDRYTDGKSYVQTVLESRELAEKM